MNSIFSTLAVLVVGMVVLMAGILINKDPDQSMQDVLSESLVWGVAFFFSFGAQTLIIHEF
ncbi:MAG: hypothetical protein PHP70_03865 [Gallionella sp.]|nr:hypothetical protein [Gallionella sp.]